MWANDRRTGRTNRASRALTAFSASSPFCTFLVGT